MLPLHNSSCSCSCCPILSLNLIFYLRMLSKASLLDDRVKRCKVIQLKIDCFGDVLDFETVSATSSFRRRRPLLLSRAMVARGVIPRVKLAFDVCDPHGEEGGVPQCDPSGEEGGVPNCFQCNFSTRHFVHVIGFELNWSPNQSSQFLV